MTYRKESYKTVYCGKVQDLIVALQQCPQYARVMLEDGPQIHIHTANGGMTVNISTKSDIELADQYKDEIEA